MSKYEWAKGFPSKGVDPDKAGKAIDRVRHKTTGGANPEDVVNAAKSSRNALHKLFTWDDSEAAQQYRLEQARGVLRSLTCRVKVVGVKEPINTRAFVHIKRKEQAGSYEPVETVLSDKEMSSAWLKRALSELQSWRRRYATIKELVSVRSQIDGLVESIEELA